MTFKDRAFNLAPWAIAALLIAAIVHIVSILLMPRVAPRDAYARLSASILSSGTTPGGVALLAPSGPASQPLPFEDPAMAEGVCLFDLKTGPLHLSASVDTDGDDYLGLSFHGASGAIFHAMTDRGSIKGKIDIVIGDARQIQELEADDSDEAPPQETRLSAPSAKGFVLIRAFSKRPSDFLRAQSRVAAVTCEPMAPPEP